MGKNEIVLSAIE